MRSMAKLALQLTRNHPLEIKSNQIKQKRNMLTLVTTRSNLASGAAGSGGSDDMVFSLSLSHLRLPLFPFILLTSSIHMTDEIPGICNLRYTLPVTILVYKPPLQSLPGSCINLREGSDWNYLNQSQYPGGENI